MKCYGGGVLQSLVYLYELNSHLTPDDLQSLQWRSTITSNNQNVSTEPQMHITNRDGINCEVDVEFSTYRLALVRGLGEQGRPPACAVGQKSLRFKSPQFPHSLPDPPASLDI